MASITTQKRVFCWGILFLFFLSALLALPMQGFASSIWHVLLGLVLLSIMLLTSARNEHHLFYSCTLAASLLIVNVWLGLVYDAIPWVDNILHFCGGLVIAHFLSRFTKNPFVLVSAVLTVGVFWEWAEYIAWFFTGLHGYSLDPLDPLLDLFMDMLGAIVFYTFISLKKK